MEDNLQNNISEAGNQSTQQNTQFNDKINKIESKATDWWAKHNVTTRTVILTVLALFAGTVILSWFNKDISHFNEIIHELSNTLTWLTIIVIAGVNGASVVMDKIVKMKKGI